MTFFLKQIAAATARSAVMEAENHLKNRALGAETKRKYWVDVKKWQKIVGACVILLLCMTAMAQTHVSNIRIFHQADEYLFIMYDLTSTADIEVHISIDGGEIFRGPLRHVEGAVGKSVPPEKNKIIAWNVFAEYGSVDYENVVIKIIANATDSEPEEVSGFNSSFGVEFGAGITYGWLGSGQLFDGSLRYTMRNKKKPYFGIDYKLNFGGGLYTNYEYYYFVNGNNREYMYDIFVHIHALAGPRIISKHFGQTKELTVYSAIRFGVGYYTMERYDDYETVSLNNEFSIGVDWDLFGFQSNRFFLAANIRADTYFGLFFGGRIGVDLIR